MRVTIFNIFIIFSLRFRWIQQAVFRSIAYHSRTIRLPVHVHNLLNRVRKVKNRTERELGRPPTNEEMAEALDMPTEQYNKMLRLTRRSISLEMPKYQSNPKDLGHESEDLLGDSIAASNNVLDDTTPEKRVDRGLFHQDLNDMLDVLDVLTKAATAQSKQTMVFVGDSVMQQVFEGLLCEVGRL